MSRPAELWSNDEVLAYLQVINLGDLVPIFKSHDIQGEDLVGLTDSELKAELNITRLQARRIKQHLEDGGAGYKKPHDEAQAAVDVTGDIPRAEAPDFQDRETLVPSHGSFLRTAPPAAALGVPVEAVPAIHIDAATVQRYGETIELIARLESEQVTVRLPGAREALVQLERRLGSEQVKFNELVKAQQKSQAKADELADGKWYPGKFIMGKSSAAAKVDKAQGKSEEYALKVNAAGAVLEGLHRQQAGLRNEVNDLNAKASRLQQARQWEEGILPQVFGGMIGDAREHALEREVDALVPQLQATRQYQTSYGQAYELIRSGRKQMCQSKELFQSAYGLANLNLMSSAMRGPAFGGRRQGPMGNMADIAKRAQSRQAAELANAACDAIIKARSIIPDMPHVKLDQVRGLRGLGLMGIMFDSVLMDVVARQKVQSAMRAVDAIIPDVVAAERWLEGWLGRVKADLRSTEQRYASKKAELDAMRREIMMSLVQAQAQAASAAHSLAVPPVLVATVGPAARSAPKAAAPSAPIPDLL